MVSDRGLEKIIENIGFLDNKRLAERYSESTALFFPSLTESYGNPLLEAASFGLPALVADLPYAHDVMGDAAIYFNPTDVGSAINAIERLANPEVRRELSAKSLKRFKESPTWDEIARRYVDVLKASIGDTSSA